MRGFKAIRILGVRKAVADERRSFRESPVPAKPHITQLRLKGDNRLRIFYGIGRRFGIVLWSFEALKPPHAADGFRYAKPLHCRFTWHTAVLCVKRTGASPKILPIRPVSAKLLTSRQRLNDLRS